MDRHTSTSQKRLPYPFAKGDRVRDIWTGEEFTVIRSYWQDYAGGDTADYTVLLEPTATKPTPWNKSSNLDLVARAEGRA